MVDEEWENFLNNLPPVEKEPVSPPLHRMRAETLPPQIFVGRRPAPCLMDQLQDRVDNPFVRKPSRGGLWTSSMNAEGQTSWIQWLSRHPEEDKSSVEDPWWRLSPTSDGYVLVVDSMEDFDALAANYLLLGVEGWGPVLRFTVMAKKLDVVGLHVTERGLEAVGPRNLYGWDCESTLWFTWAFGEPQELPRKNIATGG